MEIQRKCGIEGHGQSSNHYCGTSNQSQKKEPRSKMYTDIGDFIESEPPNKVAHEWEQSIVEVVHFLKPLTVENQIILDPLMGSGTTGIAVLNHNRKFIGIEIDKDNFEIAKHRISKVVKENKVEK